jgi:hypothetical protein
MLTESYFYYDCKEVQFLMSFAFIYVIFLNMNMEVLRLLRILLFRPIL